MVKGKRSNDESAVDTNKLELVVQGIWQQGEYTISTNRHQLDIAVIHHWLTSSYWANGIPVEVVRRSIECSFPFGLYKDNKQVGFARVITDHATFAYLADVFILEDHRGRGLGKWLLEVIIEHPELQGLRRWMLATQDAHGLYGKFGFTQLEDAAIYMEKHLRNAYKDLARNGAARC